MNDFLEHPNYSNREFYKIYGHLSEDRLDYLFDLEDEPKQDEECSNCSDIVYEFEWLKGSIEGIYQQLSNVLESLNDEMTGKVFYELGEIKQQLYRII